MGQSNFQTGLPEGSSKHKCFECPSLQNRTVEYQCRVRIDNVALRSICVLRRRVLLELIAVRDRSILCKPTQWAPTAVWYLKCNRNVEGCPINACLPTRYDAIKEPWRLRRKPVSLKFNSWFWSKVADGGLLVKKPSGTQLKRKRWS